ncbi:hypothetical protein Pmani_001384 [Petrolisthes manimaculis]|uniref:Regucalcin n=1 Tax=Petrolisthes manimaculis TaxID=1843537 RepID=A0AAE1QMT9_9EUCA|nr:hypothetical protein Pmani_001384 [Petrolisthes manimaculis]
MESVRVEAVTPPVTLGEGPHWSNIEQALYYVDIFNQNVHRYHPDTDTHTTLHIEGGPVTLVVPHETRPNVFIVSVGLCLAAVTWPDPTRSHRTSTFTTLTSVDRTKPDNRFNDGKCDHLGRLWAGTMGKTDVPDNPVPHQGSLFVLGQGCATPILDKVSISNGLAWSEDCNTFYFVDTAAYTVDAFKCNMKTANISERRTVLDYRKEGLYPAFPDGMTIDTQGRLWVACFGAGKVHCIDPSKCEIVRSVKLPTNSLTSVCWGGPNLDHLYVTTTTKMLTKEQLQAQPQAGAVFR